MRMKNHSKEFCKLTFLSLNINLDEVPLEHLDHYIAVENLLTDEDEVPSNADNLEKVRPYIESLHHLCKVQAWKPVKSILDVPVSINTSKVNFALPFVEYLLFKSQFKILIEISDNIITSFYEGEIDLSPIKILKARALSISGVLSEAISIYEELLMTSLDAEIYLETNARLAISKVQLGNYQEGIPKLKESLKQIDYLLATNLNNLNQLNFFVLKAELLSSLAGYNMNLGRLDDASILYSEALTILQHKNIVHKIINILVHQGIILRKKLCITESIVSLEKAKFMAIEFQNERALLWINHHLAWSFRLQDKYQEAEESCLRSLEGYQKINDERGTFDSYELLGWICLDKGKLNEAIQNFEIAQNWKEANGYIVGTASCVIGLAVTYQRRGKFLKSIQALLKGLNFYHKAGILNLSRLNKVLHLVCPFHKKLLNEQT